MTEQENRTEGGVDDVALRPGARIALVSTTDPHTRVQPNAMGTVLCVDDLGTVHVEFDTGETLGLIPGEDVWQPLHPRWDVQPMVQTHLPVPGADAATKETER